MSDYNIKLISNLLLGISNPNSNIITNSINQLQILYTKNFDIFLDSILNIIEKTTNSSEQENIRLRDISLVICRKVIEITDYEEWEKIEEKTKEKIKNKLLNLMKNEIYNRQNMKMFDIIIELFSKIFENEEIWPELLDTVLSIFNYDPQQGEQNSKQIIALLYLIKGGINFLYKKISYFLYKMVQYLKLLFNSTNLDIKAKLLSGELIYEMISLSNTLEINELKILINDILILFKDYYYKYQNDKRSENNIKSFLQILINIENVESNLLRIYFTEIFNITKQIISNNNIEDKKIKEMSFELIVSIIEDNPSLIEESENSYEIIYTLFEHMLIFSLDFDKNIENNTYDFILDINNDLEQYFIEEEINLVNILCERIFESLDSSFYHKAFKIFVANYFNISWKHKYIIIFIIISYNKNNNDINFFKQLFECISDLLISSNNKIKFASLFCFKNLIIKYKRNFLEIYSNEIFPLFTNLINNENTFECKYEILFCLKYILRFSNQDELIKFNESIITSLMNIFIEQNSPLVIRKLILINILEIYSKKDIININFLLNKIEINAFLLYFINLFNKMIDFNLYPKLIEVIILLNQHNEILLKNNTEIILSYLIKLFNLIEINEKNNEQILSIEELANTFKKIFPILIRNECNKELINNLITILISLINSEKNLYFSKLKEINREKDLIIYENDETDFNSGYNLEKMKLSSFLSMIFTVLDSVNSIIIKPFLNLIENEIKPLIEYPLDKNSKKIIVNIIIKIIYFSENKSEKSLNYINILLKLIDNETEQKNVKVYLEKLKEIIEFNDSGFLNKNELDYLFNKLYKYIYNIKIKSNQLIEKEKNRNNNIKKKEEINDTSDYINLLKKEIENYEDIQSEIIDIFGILLKTHKNKSNYIIDQIINTLIPFFINSNNVFDIKLSLNLCDDLILYLGQELLLENIWDSLFLTLKQFINYQDNYIIQISAYGIGIFAQNTKYNFDKYSKDIIESLYKSLCYSLKLKQTSNIDNEDLFLALDNIIAAIGKVIYYHYDNKIIKDNFNDLITNWIINLPIKYDETECLEQHEWLVNLFLNNKNLIPLNCYNHYFKTISEIYKTKYSNDKIDKNIEIIFINFVKKDEELLNILSNIYENSSIEIKKKLNILEKQN